MKGITRHFSKHLPKVISKAKDPYKNYLGQLRDILKTDLVSRGWKYREINEGGMTQEIELFRQHSDANLCIKALPTKLDLDEEVMESEQGESRSNKIMDLIQQKMTNQNQASLLQMLESAKNQMEEEEKEGVTNEDDEIEVAEVIKTMSNFVLGIHPFNSPTAVVLICKSESGQLTIDSMYASTEHLAYPKYDGKLFLMNAINTKLYIGPKFEFIDNYLQILVHEYLVKFEIDEQFILALELLSAGWEIKRTEESMAFLENLKSTKLIKA